MDDIIIAPFFKKAVGEVLDEYDCLAIDWHKTQLSTILAILIALSTQSSSNSNVALAPTNQSPNNSNQSNLLHAP